MIIVFADKPRSGYVEGTVCKNLEELKSEIEKGNFHAEIGDSLFIGELPDLKEHVYEIGVVPRNSKKRKK